MKSPDFTGYVEADSPASAAEAFVEKNFSGHFDYCTEAEIKVQPDMPGYGVQGPAQSFCVDVIPEPTFYAKPL